MIIEGLLTTTRDDGSPHVAPMGPVVDVDLNRWTLRPFQSSTTYRLLRSKPNCVFHVMDDVLPIVQSALGLENELEFVRVSDLTSPDGESDASESQPAVWAIASACHWYQLRVTQWDISQERSQAAACVVQQQVLRPFWGWNRAKHAVLEATILATRLHLIERSTVDAELSRLVVAIEKTAGEREWRAWQLLMNHFAGRGCSA